MRSELSISLLFCCLCALPVTAAEVNCQDLDELKSDLYDSGFSRLLELAVETNSMLCRSMLSDNRADEVQNTVLAYSQAFKDLLSESFDFDHFTMIETQFDFFENRVANMGDTVDEQALDQLKSGGDLTTELYFSRSTPSGQRSEIPAALDTKCNTPVGTSRTYNDCKTAFDDASRAFNAYRYAYDQYRYDLNQAELQVLSNSWERFLNEARPQTLLDVIVTTRFNRGYLKQTKLLAPPSTQYFVLRPQIVYEYLGGANVGDRERIALAVEWGGVNWWDWKVPFGVSVVSIITDEANVDSIGHGALFTFYNRYSIGYVRRGGDNGVFVTVDLLKLFQNKAQTFEQYKSRF